MVDDASVGLNFEPLEDFVIICDFVKENEDTVSFNAIRCYMLRKLSRIDISNRPYLVICLKSPMFCILRVTRGNF